MVYTVLIGSPIFMVMQSFSQTVDEEKTKIVEVIKESYIGAAHNNIDIEILKKGFH